MKTLTNIQTGILKEFDRFFQNVEFLNQGSTEIFQLFENECSGDIEDIKESPEFWVSEFIDPYDGKHYAIAADGEATSSGKYVVAEILNESKLN